jgi:hypothetical protein
MDLFLEGVKGNQIELLRTMLFKPAEFIELIRFLQGLTDIPFFRKNAHTPIGIDAAGIDG